MIWEDFFDIGHIFYHQSLINQKKNLIIIIINIYNLELPVLLKD